MIVDGDHDEIDKAMETANNDPDAVKVMIRPYLYQSGAIFPNIDY